MSNIISQHFACTAPPNIGQYQASGGYSSVDIAFQWGPEKIIHEVEAAQVYGRGGAGFPCGLKWKLRGLQAPYPRYLICNLDESEPGTFKDRYLLYQDPHQIIESMIIAAYALQAEKAYIFIRSEYQKGAERLQKAMNEAHAHGLLGRNIKGSGFDLDLQIHLSAGRYICGEAKAQLNAIEGRRPNPRPKFPRTSVKGLWQKPTITNNVETLVNVPHILKHGAQWYKDLGLNGATGTKLFGLSGDIPQPGIYELPLGSSLADFLYHQGGLRDINDVLAILPGGASTPFVSMQHAQTPMDFQSFEKINARLGTGCITVFSKQRCPIKLLINILKFFARESCGFCTPCRDGIPYVLHLIENIQVGQARDQDLQHLTELTQDISQQAFCAFAPGAMAPLSSALDLFADHFSQHVKEGSCPLS